MFNENRPSQEGSVTGGQRSIAADRLVRTERRAPRRRRTTGRRRRPSRNAAGNHGPSSQRRSHQIHRRAHPAGHVFLRNNRTMSADHMITTRIQPKTNRIQRDAAKLDSDQTVPLHHGNHGDQPDHPPSRTKDPKAQPHGTRWQSGKSVRAAANERQEGPILHCSEKAASHYAERPRKMPSKVLSRQTNAHATTCPYRTFTISTVDGPATVNGG